MHGLIDIILAFDAPSNLLRVAVIDTGTGMSEEEIARSTNTLGYLMRTATHNSNGIGLGLTISLELVAIYGGNLKVHSYGHNQGTFVEFSIKVKPANSKDSLLQQIDTTSNKK